jgi:integrase/recombinase XerD
MSAMSTGDCSLRLEQRDEDWVLDGPEAARFGLVNEYLSYLADRNYSPRTVRAYGFDLLAFCRWLSAEQVELAAVTTDVLLRFLAACREAKVAGRPGPNVVSMAGRRLDHYAAATINHRMIAISGMFAFRGMRDPDAPNPVPKGREARRTSAGERNGLLAHVARRPKSRSALRLREPRRLPRALDLREAAELLASFHAWRDRAIAGLMLYCGLRSAEVLGMNVTPWLVGPGLVTLSGR